MSDDLKQFKDNQNSGREEIKQSVSEFLKKLNPYALHQFGSEAKGTSDEFSDLDFFITLTDESFDRIVQSREKTFAKVDPILLRLHDKLPNPAGWYHDLIIYDADKGLFQIDYYITPQSKAILPPNAKLIVGENNIPTGNWSLENTEDSAEHDLIEAILVMSFVGVKGIVRKWDSGFFDFLRILYNSYKRDENPSIPELPRENDFNLIMAILSNLNNVGTEKQQVANMKIRDYTIEVEQLYNSNI
jgi:hypothetical protein